LEKNRGEISNILVKVMLSVCLYYEDIRDQLSLSSDTTIKMFKDFIAEKYVPLEAQLLFIFIKGK
jgi:hypothetical protein